MTVISGIDTVEVSDIDFSLFGHGYYAEAAPVMYDMKLLIEGTHDPLRRMRLEADSTPSGEPYWRFRK